MGEPSSTSEQEERRKEKQWQSGLTMRRHGCLYATDPGIEIYDHLNKMATVNGTLGSRVDTYRRYHTVEVLQGSLVMDRSNRMTGVRRGPLETHI